MKNKMIKIATLSLIAACFTGASFADDVKACHAQQALVKNELDKLHAVGEFKELVYEPSNLKTGCSVGLVVKVDSVEEMNAVHIKFIDHLKEVTDMKLSYAKQYNKI